MARERKSLIEPVLPPATPPPDGDDVLSRIIAKDRQRRRDDDADLASGEAPQEVTGLQGYNVTSNLSYNVTRLQEAPAPGPPAAPPPPEGDSPTPRRRRETPPTGADTRTADARDIATREERLGKALRLTAADEISVVTVRISNKLNDYMDRYVARLNRVDPSRHYRKQDAVAEAFAAFFADHPLPPLPAEEEL